ncbi:Hypothetical protein POVR2_LOCUS376 [uncultured virus]|nr:Hypothetical protein POVR2_LOCUS376 [uncultured virus]
MSYKLDYIEQISIFKIYKVVVTNNEDKNVLSGTEGESLDRSRLEARQEVVINNASVRTREKRSGEIRF